jgi:hypothetical protein
VADVFEGFCAVLAADIEEHFFAAAGKRVSPYVLLLCMCPDVTHRPTPNGAGEGIIGRVNATYGCSSTKLDASYTLSCTTMYKSFFVVCSETSEYVNSLVTIVSELSEFEFTRNRGYEENRCRGVEVSRFGSRIRKAAVECSGRKGGRGIWLGRDWPARLRLPDSLQKGEERPWGRGAGQFASRGLSSSRKICVRKKSRCKVKMQSQDAKAKVKLIKGIIYSHHATVPNST